MACELQVLGNGRRQTGGRVKHPIIRDRDAKFPAAFDALMAGAAVKVVTTGIGTPRMDSLMERWIQTCRRELLDRTLIWNQRRSSAPSASSRTSTTAIARTEP